MAHIAVRAKFERRCGMCDELIEEDSPIVNVDDEWVHATCAEEAGEVVIPWAQGARGRTCGNDAG